jgi:transcriptional regulator with XRE-family HTH domain
MKSYKEFGALLTRSRLAAGIAQQSELALRLNVRQQTVSRWELGTSRPKASEIPRIATVLQCDVDALLVAAGYAKPSVPQVSFDLPWPTDALSPLTFERFCTDIVQLLYPDAEVYRYGDVGQKQDGIDLRALFPDGQVHTFQCKRHSAFGPKKIDAAVKAHTQKADKKVILISGIASPQAREAIRMHVGWELWDREDLSRRIRLHLSKADQRRLVDTYFPGQALNLLGELDPSPWRTPEEFFAPMLATQRGFNHSWALVGRTQELDQMLAFAAVSDATKPILFLVGNGGAGKSKLLHVFSERIERDLPALKLYFLAREAVTSKGLALLGEHPKLLVCDDAHDRDDLNLLFDHVANPKNQARLIVSLRRYGLERTQRQAGFLLQDLPRIELPKLPVTDSEALAREALQRFGGDAAHAERLARYTRDCPLATVIGAEVLSKSTKALPEFLLGEEPFRDALMGRLVEEIVSSVSDGLNERSVRQVLTSMALLQPVRSDDTTLTNALGTLFGLQPNEIARILKRLKDAGVLFQRGSYGRIAPDLLGDFLIENDCIVAAGQSTGFAERLFDAVPEAAVENLLVNLGRLDWRKSNGDTRQSRTLDGLWSRLDLSTDYETPHSRAATAAAYYQPAQALSLVRGLIENGRSREPIARILKNVAYHFDHLDAACASLWELGKRDNRALNSHPSHAIRILSELAHPEPNKPVGYNDRVVDFALSLFDDDDSWSGAYTPLDIVGGMLATEGHTTTATYREMTMTPFLVRQQAMQAVRKKVIDACIGLLTHPDSSRGVRATVSLHEALRYPMGQFNVKIDRSSYDQWTGEFCQTLTAINALLDHTTIAPVVLLKLAEATSWHAQHARGETAPLARKVLDRLNTDNRTQTVQMLFDGWGRISTHVGAQLSSQQRQQRLQDFARSLVLQYPEPSKLRDFIEGCLQEAASGKARSDSSPMLIGHLIEASPALASLILKELDEGTNSHIARHAGLALARLLKEQDEYALSFVARALEPAGLHLPVIAEAYLYRTGPIAPTEADRHVLSVLAASREPKVLRYAINAIHSLATQDPALAAELLSRIDYTVAPWVAHESLLWLCDENTFEFDSLSEDQLGRILDKLKGMADLSDHWVETFLKKTLQRYPRKLLQFLMKRLINADANDWSFRPLASGPYRNIPMEFMALGDAPMLLTELLDWGLGQPRGNTFDYHFGQMIEGLCAPFDERFVATLEAWVEGGGAERLSFVLPILRDVPGDFVFKHQDSVLRLFRRSKSYGAKMLRALRSTLFSSAAFGSRSGTPREPFPEDLELQKSATEALGKLGRFDPAYEFYADLIKHAEHEIERQRREAADHEAEED